MIDLDPTDTTRSYLQLKAHALNDLYLARRIRDSAMVGFEVGLLRNQWLLAASQYGENPR
jgi:hypothetical protein